MVWHDENRITCRRSFGYYAKPLLHLKTKGNFFALFVLIFFSFRSLYTNYARGSSINPVGPHFSQIIIPHTLPSPHTFPISYNTQVTLSSYLPLPPSKEDGIYGRSTTKQKRKIVMLKCVAKGKVSCGKEKKPNFML